MFEGASMLEEMAQEVDESKSDTESERGKLEQKKVLLDKFGLGASLDNGISEMDDSLSQLEDLRSSIIDLYAIMNGAYLYRTVKNVERTILNGQRLLTTITVITTR